MKKIVLTMVVLLSMTAMMAQGSDKRERRAEPTTEEMTERMAKSLDLTADQKAKVLALNTEYKDVLRTPGMRGPRGPRPDGQTGATQQQQRPQRPQLTDEQRAQFQQHMEKRKEYDQKLKAILTADQYKKYQDQHQRRGRRGGPRGPRPADIPQD